ncbi:MAG: geranylgeranylglyceryl/heptaprenylglyceryl phosphate synthase [Flavobacteriales bacterium]
MSNNSLYRIIKNSGLKKKKLLAILIDPEDFSINDTASFLKKIPEETSHLFVGGSTNENHLTKTVVKELKKESKLPVFLFPGDYSQITPCADALLFLTLLSGRNPEYLIEQQIKAVTKLKESTIEVIATGYILIDGGTTSSVERVSKTLPINQKNIQLIVNTAKAGEYLGVKLIYLEAGSGAKKRVSDEIIKAVKKEINIPLIVGGGIKTNIEKNKAYQAGADIVVMGTIFETKNIK